MKKKRIIIGGVLAALVIAYIVSNIPNFRHHAELNQTVRALRGLPRERIDSATKAFVRAQKAQGRPVSDTVSLRELVAGGFLRADEAAPFGGMDVTFRTEVDETRPQRVVVRVRLPSGRVVVELGDGSIQEVTR